MRKLFETNKIPFPVYRIKEFNRKKINPTG
jgi:hypothetical protein